MRQVRESKRTPKGVRQESPGRKPWELRQVQMSALKGRCRLLRPFSTKPACGVPNGKGT